MVIPIPSAPLRLLLYAPPVDQPRRLVASAGHEDLDCVIEQAATMRRAQEWLRAGRADVALAWLDPEDSKGTHRLQGLLLAARETPVIAVIPRARPSAALAAMRLGAHDAFAESELDCARLLDALRRLGTPRAGERLRAATSGLDTAHRLIREDLRSPVVTLDYLVHELSETIQAPPGSPTADTLGRIQHVIGDLDLLVRELTQLTRPEIVTRRAPLGLAAAVRRHLRLHAPALERAGVQVDIAVDDLPDLLVDAAALDRLLGQLVELAVHHTRPNGGRLEVRARPMGPPDRRVAWRLEVGHNGESSPGHNRLGWAAAERAAALVGAALALRPGDDGGVVYVVRFPAECLAPDDRWRVRTARRIATAAHR